MEQKIVEKIKLLDDISLTEWMKIKVIIDRTFDKQIGEFKQQLKLSCDNLCDKF